MTYSSPDGEGSGPIRGEGGLQRNDAYDDMTQERASTLLKLGLHGPRKAADDLAEEFEQAGGPRWIEAQFRRPPFSEFPNPGPALLSGGASLEAITSLKDRAKELVKKPATREAYLAGLTGYYFAIASALVHHKVLITRQSKLELETVLQELAAAAPEPWTGFLTQAAALVPITGSAV